MCYVTASHINTNTTETQTLILFFQTSNACKFVSTATWPHTHRRRPTSVATARKCSIAKTTSRTTCTHTTPTRRHSAVPSAARATTPSWASEGIRLCTRHTVVTSPARCVCAHIPAPPCCSSTCVPTPAKVPQLQPRRSGTSVSTVSGASTHVRTCGAT